MEISKTEARALLQERGLRTTAPRLAVLRVLSRSAVPLSHSEVIEHLGETDWDPATIYRNLVKLKEAGIAPVVSNAGGIDRYALARPGDDDHHHAHFVCDDCGRVACLPAEVTASLAVDGRWAESVEKAMIQLRGECPDCIARGASEPG